MTQRPELYGPLALQLRDAVREDLERRFGELCVSRGVLSTADLRRGLDEQKRLRDEGSDTSLVHALTRLGLVDGGGPLWPLFDEVLASPSEVPAPGGRLGRYELVCEVGRGGSGTVYKAYDTTLHRIVAVKTIKSEHAEPAELVRSLVREAQTLAGLSHKNIVAVTLTEFIDDIDGARHRHCDFENRNPSFTDDFRHSDGFVGRCGAHDGDYAN